MTVSTTQRICYRVFIFQTFYYFQSMPLFSGLVCEFHRKNSFFFNYKRKKKVERNIDGPSHQTIRRLKATGTFHKLFGSNGVLRIFFFHQKLQKNDCFWKIFKPAFLEFKFRVILNLHWIPFHSVVVFGPEHDF